MIKLDTTPTLFNLDKVEKIAAEIREGDPDWTYEIVNGDGSKGPYASIRILDEEGEFVGYV